MAKEFQMFDAAFQQLVAALARCLDTEQQWISCFVEAGIRTDRFADDMSFPFDVQNVVLDLEGDANRM